MKNELSLWIDKHTCDLNKVDFDQYVERLDAEFGDAYELKIARHTPIASQSDQDFSDRGAIAQMGYFGAADMVPVMTKARTIFASLAKPAGNLGAR